MIPQNTSRQVSTVSVNTATSASNVGDSVTYVITALGSPTHPSVCTNSVLSYSPAVDGNQGEVGASPYVTAPARTRFVALQPCNTNLGDTIRVSLLPGTTTTVVSLGNFKVSGVYVLVNGVNANANLQVTDLNNGFSQNVVVTTVGNRSRLPRG